MTKNILTLIIICNLYIYEVNAQFIEIKKVTAVSENKVDKRQAIILPMILESSLVIKNSIDNVIDPSFLTKRGKYSYLLDSSKPLSNLKNNKTFSREANQGVFILDALEDLELNRNDSLRVVLVGASKRIMITDGSFIIKFNNMNNRIKFSKDYELEVVQEFPTHTVYKSSGFLGINDLLDRINQDERVIGIEINLLDPDLKTN